MGALLPQAPHRSPRQAFGGNLGLGGLAPGFYALQQGRSGPIGGGRDHACVENRLGEQCLFVMSFRKESDDTYHTIERVCRGYGFEPDRTDKNDATTDRIYNRIVQGIQRAAFVVADVTFGSVNVYYELGFAEALGKDVIVVAKEGTNLPFDTNDIPTAFFSDQTRLEEALRSRIGRLTGRQARGAP